MHFRVKKLNLDICEHASSRQNSTPGSYDKHLFEYLQIPGYKFSYRNRKERQGKGVQLYIQDSIEYIVMT